VICFEVTSCLCLGCRHDGKVDAVTAVSCVT